MPEYYISFAYFYLLSCPFAGFGQFSAELRERSFCCVLFYYDYVHARVITICTLACPARLSLSFLGPGHIIRYVLSLLLFHFKAPVSDVEAIEGQQASLVCPTTTSNSDKVNLVLWFRDGTGPSIYR